MIKYKSISEIENRYSKYRLSKELKRISDEDEEILNPRIFFLRDGKFKEYFVREDCIHEIQVQKNNNSGIKNFFITIRVCRSNYNEDFYRRLIYSIHSLKPSKKIEYVIEGEKNKKHLHFNLKISRNELVRMFNKLCNNEYMILKYLNASMTQVQKNFFKLNNSYTVPIFIDEIIDEINLKAYLEKETEIQVINKNGK